MARLKSKVNVSLAALMVNTLDRKGDEMPYDWFIKEALRLLPKDTRVMSVSEIIDVTPRLYRSWMVEYDSPFFTEDFAFEMMFERKALMAGTNPLYQYSTATEIIPLKENSSENTNS